MTMPRRVARPASAFFAAVYFSLLVSGAAAAGSPARLVLALDGIAYRDMQALQAGVVRTNFWGGRYELRAFTADEGYFPVSRMISTFPSTSDVAWTDIFGDRPLPGYQRTYFSAAANSLIVLNGVTTTMEHERQMDWQVQNGLRRSLGYLLPVHTFDYEMHGLVENFWNTGGARDTYYVYLRASDDSQHLDRDILALLCELDQRLQKLRADYKARAGRDLEIVILSDHGHNHAGRGIPVHDRVFLEKAGYHVGSHIRGPKDVVLPVVGIENWVEMHCYPGETTNLARQLCHLTGADLVTAVVPDRTNCFLVMNPQGECAHIFWKPEQNAFRYEMDDGDPLHYRPVQEELSRKNLLDGDGFAGADVWMAATMTNHYPLALERIARGLTRGALNPATIIVSLDNRYVNDRWLTDAGSRLVTCRSTHGALDDICSDGIVLCNFTPTHDTSTSRVAEQFGGFPRLRNFRAEESGGELVTKDEQALARIERDPFDKTYQQLPDGSPDGVYLRIWSPQLARAGAAAIALAIERVPQYATSAGPVRLLLDHPVALPGGDGVERIYLLPADLRLEPSSRYKATVGIAGAVKSGPLLGFEFHTGPDGKPAPY
jgi:hypothetical protein